MSTNLAQTHEDPYTPASHVELDNQLMRAYLSGDGLAVERVMALIAVAERQSRATASV